MGKGMNTKVSVREAQPWSKEGDGCKNGDGVRNVSVGRRGKAREGGKKGSAVRGWSKERGGGTRKEVTADKGGYEGVRQHVLM